MMSVQTPVSEPAPPKDEDCPAEDCECEPCECPPEECEPPCDPPCPPPSTEVFEGATASGVGVSAGADTPQSVDDDSPSHPPATTSVVAVETGETGDDCAPPDPELEVEELEETEAVSTAPVPAASTTTEPTTDDDDEGEEIDADGTRQMMDAVVAEAVAETTAEQEAESSGASAAPESVAPPPRPDDPVQRRDNTYLDLGGQSHEFGVVINNDLCRKYRHVKDKAINLLKNLDFNQANYIDLVMEVMEIVEENDELKGDDKRDLTIFIAGRIAKRFHLFNNSDHDLRRFLAVLPNLFEVVAQMTRGTLSLAPAKRDVIKKPREVNVVTYSVYQEFQKFIDQKRVAAGMMVTSAPMLMFQLTRYVARYPMLKKLERNLMVNEVVKLFLDKLDVLYPGAEKEVLNDIRFVFTTLTPLSETYNEVSNGEFKINLRPSATEAPAPTADCGCFPWKRR